MIHPIYVKIIAAAPESLGLMGVHGAFDMVLMLYAAEITCNTMVMMGTFYKGLRTAILQWHNTF